MEVHLCIIYTINSKAIIWQTNVAYSKLMLHYSNPMLHYSNQMLHYGNPMLHYGNPMLPQCCLNCFFALITFIFIYINIQYTGIQIVTTQFLVTFIGTL